MIFRKCFLFFTMLSKNLKRNSAVKCRTNHNYYGGQRLMYFWSLNSFLFTDEKIVMFLNFFCETGVSLAESWEISSNHSASNLKDFWEESCQIVVRQKLKTFHEKSCQIIVRQNFLTIHKNDVDTVSSVACHLIDHIWHSAWSSDDVSKLIIAKVSCFVNFWPLALFFKANWCVSRFSISFFSCFEWIQQILLTGPVTLDRTK